MDARDGRTIGQAVFLSGSGATGAGTASATGDPWAGERGAGRHRAGPGGGVFADRAAVDRTGTAVAGFAFAAFPRHPLGAADDGTARLRPVIPLVRRARHRYDAVWDASTFSKNRERLLDGEIAARFLSAILARPQVKRLLSTEHFSVDGTLIEAWCSMKSFRPKDEAGADAPPPTARVVATTRSTSAAPSAAMTPMPRPPIRTRACIARAPVRGRSCATWGTS